MGVQESLALLFSLEYGFHSTVKCVSALLIKACPFLESNSMRGSITLPRLWAFKCEWKLSIFRTLLRACVVCSDIYIFNESIVSSGWSKHSERLTPCKKVPEYCQLAMNLLSKDHKGGYCSLS